ncbi:MAG: AMP-binding protein, partial [Deltaproteobacteria bacterium]|nr:AMP-binding protein [Deltaproteobacteria bacterium]
MTLPARTFPELFFAQAERKKDAVALRHKEYGIWKRVSWNQYATAVREVAAGLIALGVQPGDRVAVLGDNKPEWVFCHLGTMAAGGVTCGVYPTSAPEQIAYVVGHSEAKVLFAENEEQVDKVLQILPQLAVTNVVVWDPKGLWGFSHERIMFFDQFLEQGREALRQQPEQVKARMEAINPDDMAMIIYTSGTTGRPKGAMISHRNILSVTESFMAVFQGIEADEMISYLPLAHIYENLISLFQAIWSGSTVNFVESMDTLPQNLREVSPTVFCSVPRIWEKFASAIEIKMSDSTVVKKALYRLSVGVGMRYVKTKENSRERLLWSLVYWPCYWLVLYHLKRQLGFERIRWAVCAAAPASPELFEYFNALGIPLREGYGQTESTGVIAIQRLDRPRWGYVG